MNFSNYCLICLSYIDSFNVQFIVLQAGKIKGCEKLLQWSEPVRNHFWHCAETCDGDIELLKVKVFLKGWLASIHFYDQHFVKSYILSFTFKDKWLGIMHHVCGEHE